MMKILRFSLLSIMLLLLAACNIQSVEQFEKMEQQERSIAEGEQLDKETTIANEQSEEEPELEQPKVDPEPVVNEESPAEETAEEKSKQEEQKDTAEKEQEIVAPKKQEPIEEKPAIKQPAEQKVVEKEQTKVPENQKPSTETQKPTTEKPVQTETQKPAEPAPKKRYVTIAIRVDSLLKHWDLLDPSLQSEKYVPSSGAILNTTKYELLSDKDTVWDVLHRATKEHKIQIEYQGANENIYNSVYVEGINHLYEFSGGPLSGWMYKVNGIYPNYGASQYKLQDGDVIEWHYTVDLGRDLGHYWEGE